MDACAEIWNSFRVLTRTLPLYPPPIAPKIALKHNAESAIISHVISFLSVAKPESSIKHYTLHNK